MFSIPAIDPMSVPGARPTSDYPKVTLPDAVSLLYGQETEFVLKPTIRISHLIIRTSPGTGFWFVTMSRCRSDGLSGFTGMFVRRRVRSEVQDGALTGLRMTKERLERSR